MSSVDDRLHRTSRVAPCGRGMMAIQRCVSLAEGDRPCNEKFFSFNVLSQDDMRVYAEDEPKEARDGLDRILCGPRASEGLEELLRIRGLGFFKHVHPIVGFGGGSQGHKDLWEHTKKVVDQAVPRAAVRWAALFHDVGKVRTFGRRDGKIGFHGHEALGARMFADFAGSCGLFRKEEADRVRDIVLFLGRVESFEGEWTDSAVRRLMNDLGDRLEDVIALSSADITTGRDSKRQAILRSISELKSRIESVRAEDSLPRLPKGLGDALSERLGIPRSKEMGIIIADLERRLLAGEIGPWTDVAGYVEIVRQEREQG